MAERLALVACTEGLGKIRTGDSWSGERDEGVSTLGKVMKTCRPLSLKLTAGSTGARLVSTQKNCTSEF